MSHLSVSLDFQTQRALRSQSQLVFSWLAIDQVASAARLGISSTGAGAVALLPDNKENAQAASPFRQQRIERVEHGRDDSLRITSAAPPDEFAVLARWDEWRNRVHVRGKDDLRRAPVRENIE